MDMFVHFAILALFGALGGLARFAIAKEFTARAFFVNVVFGAFAAMLVPLFGALLADLGNLVGHAKGAVLFGLALVAGLFAKEFVNKVGRAVVEEEVKEEE